MNKNKITTRAQGQQHKNKNSMTIAATTEEQEHTNNKNDSISTKATRTTKKNTQERTNVAVTRVNETVAPKTGCPRVHILTCIVVSSKRRTKKNARRYWLPFPANCTKKLTGCRFSQTAQKKNSPPISEIASTPLVRNGAVSSTEGRKIKHMKTISAF